VCTHGVWSIAAAFERTEERNERVDIQHNRDLHVGHQGVVQTARKRLPLVGDLLCRRTQVVRPHFYRIAVKSSPAQSLTPLPGQDATTQEVAHLPQGHDSDGRMYVFLYADEAESEPPGWSQLVKYSLMVVNQTNDKFNVVMGPTSHTFKAGARGGGGNMKVLDHTFLNDIKSAMPSLGYIVNDTLIIHCEMTNVPTAAAASPATAAAATPQRETRIVDADTAAAAAIADAYPGVVLPAVAAAIAAANPDANPVAVSGAAPRVAVPAGLYPTGAGGLLYLPRGAQLNY